MVQPPFAPFSCSLTRGQAAVLLGSFSWGVYVYVAIVLADLCAPVQREIYATCFALMVLLFLLSYVRTALARHPHPPAQYHVTGRSDDTPTSLLGAGDVPVPNVRPDHNTLLHIVEGRKLDVKTCDVDGNFLYCIHCSQLKPDRTHHCSRCRRCVPRFDHHCPWVNACVGYSNHKYFLLTVIYGSASISFVLLTSTQFVVCVIIDAVNGKHVDPQRWELFAFYFAILPALYMVGDLAKFHVWLCLRNETTVDQMKNYGIRVDNPNVAEVTKTWAKTTDGANAYFSTGSRLENVKQLFGDRYILWPFPLMTSKCKPFTADIRAEQEFDAKCRLLKKKTDEQQNITPDVAMPSLPPEESATTSATDSNVRRKAPPGASPNVRSAATSSITKSRLFVPARNRQTDEDRSTKACFLPNNTAIPPNDLGLRPAVSAEAELVTLTRRVSTRTGVHSALEKHELHDSDGDDDDA